MSELALLEHERLGELEATIERGLETFVEVGRALREIRDARLYREMHGTFESYCRERWGFTPQHGGRLVAAAAVVNELEPIGSVPTNESQARELTPLLDRPEELRETWAEVQDLHPEPTAADVREAVEKKLEPRPPGSPNGLGLKVSERDFQQAVTDALTAFGWRWIHHRPARTNRGWVTALSGSPGYPDITAVRGERILFVELKAANGKLRDEQRSWLSALGAAGAETHCWRPADWPLIERLIR